jgi:2-(1,2-epoxy-1,2-dihydrophenyl)acetyl-CoA isomerase
MTDAQDPVLVSSDQAVRTITLTGPSLTIAAKSALLTALRHAATDPTVRAVVLTGSGRMFCAGQDLVEHAQALATDPSTSLTTVADHYNPIVELLTTMPKPVVAAINGVCAGAAIGFALACDVRIAAEEASFLTAFNAIGLAPDSALAKTLADAVGTARASELILLNEKFTATQAVAWGMIGRTVPRDDLPAAAAELAARLAAGPTLAFVATKRLLRGARTMTISETLGAEGVAQVALGMTADHQGAVRSFVAKQPATFTGQ